MYKYDSIIYCAIELHDVYIWLVKLFQYIYICVCVCVGERSDSHIYATANIDKFICNAARRLSKYLPNAIWLTIDFEQPIADHFAFCIGTTLVYMYMVWFLVYTCNWCAASPIQTTNNCGKFKRKQKKYFEWRRILEMHFLFVCHGKI